MDMLYTYIKIGLLSIIEGLTEFIPVSSTGHLILANAYIQLEMAHIETFEIVIQLGAILAVIVRYHTYLGSFFRNTGRFRIGHVFITTLPAGCLGWIGHSFIKAHLFSPSTVLLGLFAGGIALIIADRLVQSASTTPDYSDSEITYPKALLIGCFQSLSLFPGVSRSAATIVGGLFSRLGYQMAAEYSFIAAVPIMIAATGYDLLTTSHAMTVQEWGYIATGMGISFIVALLVIQIFIRIIATIKLAPFGYYRILISGLYWLLYSTR